MDEARPSATFKPNLPIGSMRERSERMMVYILKPITATKKLMIEIDRAIRIPDWLALAQRVIPRHYWKEEEKIDAKEFLKDTDK